MAYAHNYPMTQLGGSAFNHSAHQDAEAEYDRLRNLARQEASERSSCFNRAHTAYVSGNGALAHQLSEEGKSHARATDAHNAAASAFIFRENNAPERVPADTIDLHGQYIEEAERMLEERIRYAKASGQSHLHVIVGRGNHSRDHVQRIKPRVMEFCTELGLECREGENAGMVYVELGGRRAGTPSMDPGVGQQHGKQQHGEQQHGGNHGNQDDMEKLARKLLPRILRKLRKGCCAVM